MKTKYSLILSGCDDRTKIEVMLSNKEVEFLKKLQKQFDDASTYGCMPTLEMEEDSDIEV